MDRRRDLTRYRFHTTIHARPAQVYPGSKVECNGMLVHTLDVKPAMLAQSLNVSFEDAAEKLQKLPRMFLEPDGSFVWVSAQNGEQWQVDGVLYDRHGRLMFVDLKGECTAEGLEAILAALGSPPTPLMFQLVQQAIFLDDGEFRRCCRTEA